MTLPRLWVASELYYPEETSTGYFLTRIAEGLAATFDVHVISGRPTYSERGVAVTGRERRHGTTIYRMPATRLDKDRLLFRMANLGTFTILAFGFALVRFRRSDSVLVVTNPPTLPLAIVAAAKLRGARSALLVHDVYPEVLVAAGMLAPGGLAYRVLAAGFGWLARRFDRVVVLGRDMRAVFAAKMGAFAARVVIIANWADVDLVTPAERDDNALRHELGLDGKFVVQFSGNAGRTHDLDCIFAAAEALSGHPAVHFVLVGFGGKFAFAETEIARRGLTNVTLLPRQPRDRLATMLTCSDLTVIAFVGGMYGVSVPSRLYNILAAGIPIAAVADARSELARIVDENEAGWVLPEGGDGLAALIEQLAADPARVTARRRGDNGRQAAERRFRLERVIADYTRLLTPERAG